MKIRLSPIVTCSRAMAALALCVFPATARATGSGLEYAFFGLLGILPAVVILFALIFMFSVDKSDLSGVQRRSLVWTFLLTSGLSCAGLLLIGDDSLLVLYSPVMWIGPLIIMLWRRSSFFADDGR
ncbi:MAG: hypothetical protein WKG03_10480 [Telluria sp.]